MTTPEKLAPELAFPDALIFGDSGRFVVVSQCDVFKRRVKLCENTVEASKLASVACRAPSLNDAARGARA